jgi:O-antigen/teichoic acid export membrane protein
MTVAFLAGATCFASAIAALFFVRFWRDTGDRLFLFFAVAFAIFAVNRLLLTAIGDAEGDGRTALYLVRAAAFAMIALAIVDKNRPGRR